MIFRKESIRAIFKNKEVKLFFATFVPFLILSFSVLQYFGSPAYPNNHVFAIQYAFTHEILNASNSTIQNNPLSIGLSFLITPSLLGSYFNALFYGEIFWFSLLFILVFVIAGILSLRSKKIFGLLITSLKFLSLFLPISTIAVGGWTIFVFGVLNLLIVFR